MTGFKLAVLAAVAGCFLAVAPPKATAQVSVQFGVTPVEVAPECPYGYYDAAPYECAPYGYYGSEWFNGGIFIGTGPWFHGHDNFRGRVNNRFHPEHGYNGPRPGRGERAEPSRRLDKVSHFKGNEYRDGHGHATDRKR
jgi:hypothetical protein